MCLSLDIDLDCLDCCSICYPKGPDRLTLLDQLRPGSSFNVGPIEIGEQLKTSNMLHHHLELARRCWANTEKINVICRGQMKGKFPA